MYCVYDNNKNIIALHDELYVVETYKSHVEKSHTEPPDLRIGKIKNKKIKKIIDYDDLYLVRYADTYVQSGYSDYLNIMTDQHIYDEQQCRDVLLRILECQVDITDKERKSIERTVKVIDRLLQDSKEYTPTLNELKSCEADYAPYFYNKFW